MGPAPRVEALSSETEGPESQKNSCDFGLNVECRGLPNIGALIIGFHRVPSKGSIRGTIRV